MKRAKNIANLGIKYIDNESIDREDILKNMIKSISEYIIDNFEKLPIKIKDGKTKNGSEKTITMSLNLVSDNCYRFLKENYNEACKYDKEDKT